MVVCPACAGEEEECCAAAAIRQVKELKYDERANSRTLRYKAYRIAAQALIKLKKKPGSNRRWREPLPTCVDIAIKEAFPDRNNCYSHFKLARTGPAAMSGKFFSELCAETLFECGVGAAGIFVETDGDEHSSEYVAHFRDLCRHVARNWWRYRMWRMEGREKRRRDEANAAEAALRQATRRRIAAQREADASDTAATRRRVVAALAEETEAHGALAKADYASRVCTRRLEFLRGLEEPSADAKLQQLPKLPPNLLNEVRQREDDEGAVAGAERGMPRPRR